MLMTLVWLRLSLTGDVVGVLFAVDKSTVSRYTRLLLRLLRDHGQDTLDWPEKAQALLDEADETDGVAIIDATAQRVERARQRDAAGALCGQEGAHAQDAHRRQRARAAALCQPLGAGRAP